jgi:tetratricopeptide (TPR) repeat protein
LAERLGDRRQEGIATAYLSEMYFRQGNNERALGAFEKATDLFRTIGDRRQEAMSLFGAGQALRRLGRLPEALRSVESSIALAEFLRSETLSADLRSSFFGRVRLRFEVEVDLLMELARGQPRKSFEIRAFDESERARARAVLDELAEAHADIRLGVDGNLLNLENHVLEEIRAKDAERQIALTAKPDGGTEPSISALDGEISELLAQYDLVQSEIRSKSPRFAALVKPQPVKLREIQRDLLD